MREFWVTGGEYASTAFDRLADDATEERHGPFTTYDEALRHWRRLSLRRIDECQVRYRIVETAGDARPRRAANA
jgi:hypothetical protein